MSTQQRLDVAMLRLRHSSTMAAALSWPLLRVLACFMRCTVSRPATRSSARPVPRSMTASPLASLGDVLRLTLRGVMVVLGHRSRNTDHHRRYDNRDHKVSHSSILLCSKGQPS
ncbi:hypothetical protein [Tautonia rosea]|uniref:hypothetical protein n=1 Tax=Tautonia rosea TaxID=2728037 RepID=UPI0014738B94|nr:hypothetical protein [Tautonia rosea]